MIKFRLNKSDLYKLETFYLETEYICVDIAYILIMYQIYQI